MRKHPTDCTLPPEIFGLHFSSLSEREVATLIGTTFRSEQEGVGLIITPNIQHISLMQHNQKFVQACRHAAILTCDGFPLLYYAKMRGQKIAGRVTGRGIVADLMARPDLLARHRIFMVLDSERTVAAAREWAQRHGLQDKIAFAVPPYGFENDPEYASHLASSIRHHQITLLFMGVGAPRSEIFVDQYRDVLPPCWALCIGQALLVALGLTPQPPPLVQKLNVEWLWRIALEPRRLLTRYIYSAWGFLFAVFKDMRQRG
ncbi:WecB/TagA/CpsF family glycosyltransferase [Komagataeibacter sp. FNDCR2]|uniref:WecB/TagA/CpsF family glycosyltransferase n=1 Tax=Komagataeibacter sp. FNDCR2 TaxID=2878682 RepID=UPI001E608900|nr:WecB/TagA/CpsF family glycosyltransferase [Komagataeibacter sp. FNDCR2]MCE2576849.1 WecB/TagA/CpsF family glycosyltransferase [Komagataeibacter sp. FNDCR2]